MPTSLVMDTSRDIAWAYKLRSSEGFIVFAVAVAIFVVSLFLLVLLILGF